MDHAEQMLDKLMAAAKEVGGAAWPAYVERVYYGAVVSFTAGCLVIAVAFCVFLWSASGPGWNNKTNDPTGRGIARVLSLAFVVIGAIITLSFLPAILSPNGEAVMRLLGR